MGKGQWAYDIHIHSALSPCGHRDMTPNNIINMALLKGLDIISITDHNSGENLPALFEVAKDKDICIIPGIEVNTKEEVHLLCYFPTLSAALDFSHFIQSYLPPIPNNKELFGEQLILDSQDNVIGEKDFLLLNALNLSINEIFSFVGEKEGVVVPAHVDKRSFSMISNLGFIPPQLPIKTLEVSKNFHEKNSLIPSKLLRNYQLIQSSDAHFLEDILERQSFISLEKLTLPNLFHYLKKDIE